MRKHNALNFMSAVILGVIAACLLVNSAFAEAKNMRHPKSRHIIMWIDPLDFLAGDSSVNTSFNAVSSGVGGGLSGLIIQSTTTGDTGSSGGNKVVEKGIQVPPGYLLTGVRVCYQLANARSFITQIRLAQVQNPPSSATVLLDDATDQTNAGPVCVNSQPTSIDPGIGGVLLSFRVNFGDTSDRIVVRAVGLHLEPKP
jgi:hypothetical protein